MTQSDGKRPDRRPGTVRRAQERDRLAVGALYRTLQNAHALQCPRIFNPALADELSAEDFAASVAAEDKRVLVVERDGEIVAAAEAGLFDHAGDNTFRARRRVYVTHLITEPGARRQGHARALMQAVKDWARLHEAESIELYVWEGSAEAMAFYRALGYRAIATQLVLMVSSPDAGKDPKAGG